MKFYLSSYKLGERVAELKQLISATNKKAAYIPNALDFSTDLERRKKGEKADMADLQSAGIRAERLDLRDYFSKQEELEEKLKDYGIIWARGGSVFVLRQAMKLSGFDELLKNSLNRDDLVYGGYSAGACVLASSLKGIDLMDDVNLSPYPEITTTIWEGLGIIDYLVVPHFKSDHPESDAANDVIKYMIENKLLFKAIKDGDVLVF